MAGPTAGAAGGGRALKTQWDQWVSMGLVVVEEEEEEAVVVVVVALAARRW